MDSFATEMESIINQANDAKTPEESKAAENRFAQLVFGMNADQFKDTIQESHKKD